MKKEMLEITPDGKQEIVEGKEPLKKKPKKTTTLDDIKKSITDRWESIRKALDNESAFMSMADDDEEEEQPEGEEEQKSNNDRPVENSDSDAGAPEEADMAQDGGEAEGSMPEQEDHSQLEEELKAAGYSDAEVAHIVHGHVIPAPDVEEAKYNNEQMTGQIEVQGMMDEAEQAKAMREQEAKRNHEHAQRMNDVAYEDAQEKKSKNKLDLEHHKRMLDLEYEKHKGDSSGEIEKKKGELELKAAEAQQEDIKLEQEHKKKMLDLEYEIAKKQKELELQFKMKEHEMKLKLMEEGQKHKVVEQKEKHKMNLANSKKKASMKKSDEEEDDISKGGYVPSLDDIEADEMAYYRDKVKHEGVEKAGEFKRPQPALPEFFNNHKGTIPDSHPDYKHAVAHINNVHAAGHVNEARRLHEKYIGNNLYVKKDEDPMEKLEGMPAGWNYNPTTRNLNHSMHGSITIAPHSKDSAQYSVRHNGGEYGKFNDVNAAAQAAVNRAREFK